MTKPTPLAGSTIVITGAGSGIGRAVAQRLSAAGSPVAMVDSSPAMLEDTKDSLPGTVLARTLDVRDRLGQLAFASEVAAWAPRPIGMVLNNAGVALTSSVANASPEDDQWLWDTNFLGVVNGVRAFLPMVLEQGSGAIVNVSSVFGLVGVPDQSAYCASKFAVRGFTESLRQELRGTGARAVTVHPGGVRTNIARRARVRSDPLGAGRTADELARDFERSARTTPEKAAEILHKGVDAGKCRILVGADAYAIDCLARLAPVRYSILVDLLGRLGRRRAGRAGR